MDVYQTEHLFSVNLLQSLDLKIAKRFLRLGPELLNNSKPSIIPAFPALCPPPCQMHQCRPAHSSMRAADSSLSILCALESFAPITPPKVQSIPSQPPVKAQTQPPAEENVPTSPVNSSDSGVPSPILSSDSSSPK